MTKAKLRRLRRLVNQIDCLGFDSVEAALEAIRTHKDWRIRWDVDRYACDRSAANEIEDLLQMKRSN